MVTAVENGLRHSIIYSPFFFKFRMCLIQIVKANCLTDLETDSSFFFKFFFLQHSLVKSVRFLRIRARLQCWKMPRRRGGPLRTDSTLCLRSCFFYWPFLYVFLAVATFSVYIYVCWRQAFQNKKATETDVSKCIAGWPRKQLPTRTQQQHTPQTANVSNSISSTQDQWLKEGSWKKRQKI